jgi:N-acetylglucosamine kinase-like BadF-type ATPase
MILIADGGSTKADWILLDLSGNQKLKTRTEGLNPAVLSEKVLLQRIKTNEVLSAVKDNVTEVYFYGAGCGTIEPTLILKSIFEDFFKKAKIIIKEDTYAAAYSVTSEPGIICILGTGSNSCFFDGEHVDVRIPSLGYILMDEASGNYFGKKLIRDYYYHKMPKEIAAKFKSEYNIEADVIKHNLYKEANPNTYLAHFAEFILKNKRNAYFNKVLHKGIKEFFKNRILPIEESKELPIHFVGSIAYFSQDIITDVAKYHMVKLGKFVRRPIDGLIEFHRNKLKLKQV